LPFFFCEDELRRQLRRESASFNVDDPSLVDVVVVFF